MNYKKHYKLLCKSRQQLGRAKLAKEHPDYCYYELLHIVPRHEAGSNDASNLVLLTAREHFIAHWLFAKWKQTRKAYHALGKMQQNRHGSRLLTSSQYEICKIACSIAKQGTTVSAETRAKISRPGKQNSFYKHVHSAESRRAIGDKSINRLWSEGQKARARASHAKRTRLQVLSYLLNRQNIKQSTFILLGIEYISLLPFHNKLLWHCHEVFIDEYSLVLDDGCGSGGRLLAYAPATYTLYEA